MPIRVPVIMQWPLKFRTTSNNSETIIEKKNIIVRTQKITNLLTRVPYIVMLSRLVSHSEGLF